MSSNDARSALEWAYCLAEHTVDDNDSDLQASCWPLCNVENASLCDVLIGQLPWFADRNEACMQQWKYCVDHCQQEAGHNYYQDDESLGDTPEAVRTLGSGGLGGGHNIPYP